MRDSKSFVIPRGTPQQTCGSVRPLVIRNVYRVGALPSYQPEVPARTTAKAVKPRPSVADWERRRIARLARLRTFGCYAVGVVVLYSFMFLAALGG